MLNDATSCDAEEIVKRLRCASDFTLRLGEHEVSFCHDAVYLTVAERNTLLSKRGEKRAKPVETIRNLRIMLGVARRRDAPRRVKMLVDELTTRFKDRSIRYSRNSTSQ